MSHGVWREGNSIRLLENGEAFFPAVFGAIDNASKEVVLETFILWEDKVGLELHRVLLAAARRGVQVDVMIDGLGSPDLSRLFIEALTEAGVAHVYDFSTNVVPGQDERERGYWRDVGTIDTYYAANMDLIAPHPVFNLYNDRWPVYTQRGPEPPAAGRSAARRAE